jgi:hypothetical protein
MKKILLAACLCLVAIPAMAEVRSYKVCDSLVLAQSTTTDCTVLDISKFKFISYQFRCNSASTTITVNLDWIAGTAAGSDYLAVPILSTGTALGQLRTTYTTESVTTYSALQSIQPPVSPFGTLRFTNNAATADVTCTAWVNLGD